MFSRWRNLARYRTSLDIFLCRFGHSLVHNSKVAHPHGLQKCKRPTSDTYRYTELLKGPNRQNTDVYGRDTCFTTYSNNTNSRYLHCCRQLTATLRNLTDVSSTRPLFLSAHILPPLCRLTQLYASDADLVLNVCRVLRWVRGTLCGTGRDAPTGSVTHVPGL